ncbi:MAG: cell division protein FtsZ, partial [Thermomicrobiales bacterium]
IQGARGVLYNISGGNNLTLFETSEAAEVIRAAADEDAEIIYGTSIDESLGEGVMITLIATGFDERGAIDPFSVRNLGGSVRDVAPRQQQAPSRQPQAPAPAYPDDDWENESSIIRFLRER